MGLRHGEAKVILSLQHSLAEPAECRVTNYVTLYR